LILFAMLVGCAKPPVRNAWNDVEMEAKPSHDLVRPREGGALVRIGRVEVPANEIRIIHAVEHEELFVIVESGDFGRELGWTTGSVARIEGDVVPRARTRSSLVVVAVRDAAHPFRDDESPTPSTATSWGSAVTPDQVPVLPIGDGKLRAQIFHDAHSGARFGAIDRLDADADLDVPVHTHDSVEALFIESGDGTMLLGNERFPIEPGKVIYVDAGVRHGYEHGTTPLRAWQIYAPPGPEQRFRVSRYMQPGQ
jgi:mannose-6-phosphate isomerase-like protein (cupin superfamily)